MSHSEPRSSPKAPLNSGGAAARRAARLSKRRMPLPKPPASLVPELPSRNSNSLLLKMAIEIVDLPIKNMVIFHSNVKNYQRLPPCWSFERWVSIYYSSFKPWELQDTMGELQKTMGFQFIQLSSLLITRCA